jgi:hypothetical protein
MNTPPPHTTHHDQPLAHRPSNISKNIEMRKRFFRVGGLDAGNVGQLANGGVSWGKKNSLVIRHFADIKKSYGRTFCCGVDAPWA